MVILEGDPVQREHFLERQDSETKNVWAGQPGESQFNLPPGANLFHTLLLLHAPHCVDDWVTGSHSLLIPRGTH